ncbi:MAG: transporter [Hydrococcus sp. CRU_1_1]|nr:transporter [Hydrococcus sp. CRU_1_1]NJQ98620.1 transporter [Hydrococcus sp. CSU_1_8]
MNWFLTVVLVAISSFVATNIDDIIILMLFFSQVNDNFRPRHIIIGQYLGFTALILASLPGLFGGLIIPKAWLGLLGLAPIFIGLKQLLSREEDEATIQVVSDRSTVSLNKKFLGLSLSSFLNAQTYNVAAVTIANGGDNIGIYVPLFASGNLLSFGITLGVFYLFKGLWCFIAYLLIRQPRLGKLLARYGNIFVPFFLIGLGILILIESQTYKLLLIFQ